MKGMVGSRPWLVLLLLRLLPCCAFILHRSLLGPSSSVSISDTALVLTGSQPRGWRLSAYRGPMQIPLDKLEFRYTRSSGPGGQNVNKLNTRVELRFNVSTADWIPEDARLRMIQQQKHRINKAGELVISVQEHRTQLQNREDAVQKLKDCLAKAAIVPKERNLRVGLTDFQKKNRLQEKKKRAKVKSVRRDRNFLDD